MDKPAGGGPPVERKVFDFKGPGVAMGCITATTRSKALPRPWKKVCIDTVERGDMTRDLAILIRGDHPWLTTNQFLDKLDANLKRAMG